jgi:hypothetical protein
VQEEGVLFAVDAALLRRTALLYVVPRLRRSVAGLSPHRTLFDPGSFTVRFVVDTVSL